MSDENTTKPKEEEQQVTPSAPLEGGGLLPLFLSTDKQQQPQRQGMNTDDHTNKRDDDDDSDGRVIAESAPETSSLLSCIGYSNYYDWDLFVMSIRVAVGMTLASMFILCFSPSPSANQPFLPHQYAVWTVRTAGVVLWFPELDASMSLKRVVERSVGTAIGGALGLAFGFLAVPIATTTGQAILIAALISVGVFLAAYVSNRTQYRKQYAVVIGSITYALAIASFYDPTDPSGAASGWMPAAYRILTMFLGCAIGALVSIAVFPRWTHVHLSTNVEALARSVGKSARLVLGHSLNFFGYDKRPLTLENIIVRQRQKKKELTGEDDDEDYEAYQSCIKCIDGWKDCQTLFPMLRYDPTYRYQFSKEARTRFERYNSVLLARSFRLQASIMSLDAIARTIGIAKVGSVREWMNRIDSDALRGIGPHILQVLDLSVDVEERQKACTHLSEMDLKILRSVRVKLLEVQDLSGDDDREGNQSGRIYISPFQKADERDDGNDDDHATTCMFLEVKEQIALFFQLFEHLVLRTILFHTYCMSKPLSSDDERVVAFVNVDVGSSSNQSPQASQQISAGPEPQQKNELPETAAADAAEEGVALPKSSSAWWQGPVALLAEYDHESMVFGSRVGVSALLASLIAFLLPAGEIYPKGLFVIINALVVSWVPANDTATVVKRGFGRTLGTVIGAAGGLIFGFLSLQVGIGTSGQASFIGISIAVVGFLCTYIACILGYRSNYAATLTPTTFGLVILAFYVDDAENAWKYGVSRAVSILVGSLLAVFVCLVLWPSSTKTLLSSKVEKQLSGTGKSARLVLKMASAAIAGDLKPILITQSIHRTGEVSDEAYESYVKCTESWKGCRSMFPTLEYDPWYFMLPKERRVHFKDEMAIRLARGYRMLNNVMMLDSVIRIGIAYDGVKSDVNNLADLLQIIGQLVEEVTDLSTKSEQRDTSARELLETHLPSIRRHLDEESMKISKEQPSSHVHVPPLRDGMPGISLETQEQMVLFFQLVELLILRAVRVHYFYTSRCTT